MERDDAALLCASGDDPERFELIFERHHGAVWRFLARRGGRERADEIAGDVFVTAFACRDRFDPGRGSVEAWLYGIASNRLRTRLRSDARAARAFRRAAAQQLVEVASVDGAGDALDDRRRLGEVVAALVRMSAVDREIIMLFAWERLSYEEIATVVGVEVGTVRSRLSRARSRLRELVPPAGEARGDDRS